MQWNMFKTNKYYHDNIKNIIKNLVSKNASVYKLIYIFCNFAAFQFPHLR